MNLLTEMFFAPEEAEKLRVVEEIDIDALRDLATAYREGRVVIIGKAFQEPNGMYTTLFYKNGVLMARTDATAEESEANALAERGE